MSLHEHAALGPALPHGWGLVHLLSPTGQRGQGELGDPLQAPAGAAALQLRLERPPHRRHRGDVEHVPDAVLGDLGRALHVGHRPDLPSYCGALEHGDSGRSVSGSGSCTSISEKRQKNQMMGPGRGRSSSLLLAGTFSCVTRRHARVIKAANCLREIRTD